MIKDSAFPVLLRHFSEIIYNDTFIDEAYIYFRNVYTLTSMHRLPGQHKDYFDLDALTKQVSLVRDDTIVPISGISACVFHRTDRVYKHAGICERCGIRLYPIWYIYHEFPLFHDELVRWKRTEYRRTNKKELLPKYAQSEGFFRYEGV